MSAGDEAAAVIEPIAPDDELVALLAACDLPTADVFEQKALAFFGCRADGRLIAVVGLETAGDVALLRSLAVAPAARGHGLGQRLVAFAEHLSAARGVGALYLLTESAADWFRRRGYEDIARARAPDSIRASAQFHQLCPADADFLVRFLDA